MSARVIHTGQALVDEVLTVPGLPTRGSNVMATAQVRYPASAVNVLLAAVRSGANCVHTGSIGTGPNGDLIRAALAAEGVAISSPAVPDLDTGICVVLLEPSAERTFITTTGAERLISLHSLATSKPVAGDLVCVSGYTLLGATRAPLLDWLAGLPDGVTVVLDPGAPFADLDDAAIDAVLACTSVWTSNAAEADALVRRRHHPAPAGAPIPMAQTAPLIGTMLPPGAVVIVRDGPAGCVVHTGGATTAYPGYPQTPVDTNGAGDAHTGVLVAERAAGADWATAVTRANAAGAIKVTRHGPHTAPTAADITVFLAAIEGGFDG